MTAFEKEKLIREQYRAILKPETYEETVRQQICYYWEQERRAARHIILLAIGGIKTEPNLKGLAQMLERQFEDYKKQCDEV